MARYTTRLETTDTTRHGAVIARETGGRHAYIGTRETVTDTATHTTRETTTDTATYDDTTTRELVRDLFLWGMVN